ncbi:expressed unknown protein [Ectocarpus siliculosus]|uniref:Uncharacterized protein n=1 Tax=Ectocarpus siliculosus TaxID=2880 RepID=D7FNS0_ECTSI|nr:expressed unknown protein [Ectocarpus siliculosus]|eukprot:CBJ26081.1 expressed unknown protein [Ectocarpus siliculosus]
MKLQARKVEALEELRRQWLSGERKLPNHVPPLGSLGRVLGDDGRDVPAPTSDTRQNTGLGPKWGTSTPPSQLPIGYFEQYMTPHAKFPSSSAVVATEMFSFRLKGGSSSKRRPSSSAGGGGGGIRSGFLNVFAYLHADGMVRLRDTDAEEILVFDAGHTRREASPSLTTADSSSSATADAGSLKEAAVSAAATAAAETATPAGVVGMTADSSESGPVLVTAGADGTARVHALAVYYRGRQVAGVGVRGGRSDPSGRRKKAEASDPSSSSTRGEAPRRGTGSSEKKGDHGGDRPHGSPPPPPATAMGVGVTVEFKTCLGSACRSPDGLSQLRGMGGDGETVSVGNGGGGDQETAGSVSGSLPPQGEEMATVITSMDAFFHRSLGTTVVIAGYSSGGVSFYHAGNGTQLASVDTGSSAVLAVKRGGQSIAFTDGEDVHFASSTKFTRAPGRVCRGGRRSGGGGGSSGGGEPAVVTALAFDAVSTGVLYVGFGTGDVMAYDSRVQEMDSSYACLPSYRLPPPLPQQRPSPHADPSTATAAGDGGSGGILLGGGGCDSISTVRGYAIVSHGGLLSVYNTTDHAGRLLFTTHATAAAALAEGARTEDHCGAPLSPGTESRGGGVGAAALAAAAAAAPSGGRTWSVMSSSGSGEVLVVEASRCSAEVVVHRAVLPYERNGPDMSWVRFPVLLLGLFVVAITQVYSRRAANNAAGRTSRKKGRSGSRGWRGAGLSDEDDDGGGGGGGFSADALAQLRDDLSERTSRRRDWGGRRLGSGRGGGGGGAREQLSWSSSSSSRLPAPRQGYGDPWADEGSD